MDDQGHEKKPSFTGWGFVMFPQNYGTMHAYHQYPEEGLRGKRRRLRPMKNSFINEAGFDRTMCGISQILNKR
jgi:hypothetical protein